MLLLTDDPLTLSQQKIEQFEPKLTYDIQFLLEVEFNFHTPKIQRAMQNLNFKEQDLMQMKYSQFLIQDEDNYISEQRYLLHLQSESKLFSIQNLNLLILSNDEISCLCNHLKYLTINFFLQYNVFFLYILILTGTIYLFCYSLFCSYYYFIQF